MLVKSRRTIPLLKVSDTMLELPNGCLIDIRKEENWEKWQRFLETEKSFHYNNEQIGLSFTAIKEIRKGSKNYPLRGGQPIEVWYAHKRINYQLKRKYLGYSKNLTADKLSAVVFNIGDTHTPSFSRIKTLARNAVKTHNWESTPWIGKCEVCYKCSTKNSHIRPAYLVAHHWNGYNKDNWLNVWWICYSCNRHLPHDGSMTINDARKFIAEKV
jgi:hypothetical protein